jgi:ATP-dependent RNA helicase SUPV3L1/SUV3
MKQDRVELPGLAEIPAYSSAGRTSFPANPDFEPEIYRICGFRPLGAKAVRIDILERLADLIRPATAWQPGGEGPAPDGAAGGRAFYVTPAMLSILGATHEDMDQVLTGLGYRSEVISHEAFAELRSRISATAPQGEDGSDAAGQLAETGEKPEHNLHPPADAPADGNPDNALTSPEGQMEVSERPAMLWHLARPRAQTGQGQADKQHRTSKPGKRTRAKAAPQGKKRHAEKGAEARRHGGKANKKFEDRGKIDPDSPFAKLAHLKEALEKRDGQG